MDVGRLYEPPFTDRAPEGPDSLFNDTDVDALAEVLALVRASATPAVAS